MQKLSLNLEFIISEYIERMIKKIVKGMEETYYIDS